MWQLKYILKVLQHLQTITDHTYVMLQTHTTQNYNSHDPRYLQQHIQLKIANNYYNYKYDYYSNLYD